MPRPPTLMALTASGALLLGLSACSSDAQSLRITNGYLTPAQAQLIVDSWSDEVRDQLITHVYSDRFIRNVRACGQDPEQEALPAVVLTGKGFDLAGRHRGDLSCALVEAGVYIIAERGQPDGFTTLVAVTDNTRVLEIDVQRAPDGAIDEVYGLYSPGEGRLALRPRPQSAPGVSSFTTTVEQPVSAERSLDAVRALLGSAAFDLSAVGFGLAPGETDPADEPGCAETGDCPLMACAPAPTDEDLLRQAMFPARDKLEIVCPTLARWQTERHRITPPDDAVIRRALVLAVQAQAPESDLRNGLARVVTEHSTSGTRLVAFGELMPGLLTTPVLSQTVRQVAVDRCEGNERKQRCAVTVTVETFSRVVNIPPDMPQRVLLETLGFPSRSAEKDLQLDFRRANARWELQDEARIAQTLFNADGARVTKSTGSYLLEKLRELR